MRANIQSMILIIIQWFPSCLDNKATLDNAYYVFVCMLVVCMHGNVWKSVVHEVAMKIYYGNIMCVIITGLAIRVCLSEKEGKCNFFDIPLQRLCGSHFTYHSYTSSSCAIGLLISAIYTVETLHAPWAILGHFSYWLCFIHFSVTHFSHLNKCLPLYHCPPRSLLPAFWHSSEGSIHETY